MNIEHISVSRKTTWDSCQQMYKYKYHLRLESNEPTPFHFTYGKIVHFIAEKYIEERGKRTLNEVAGEVLQKKVPYEEDKDGNPVFAETLPPDYRNRLPGHLRAIEQLTSKIGLDGFLEYEFKYDLDPPNGKYVTGFIDRLIQKEDQWFIIDYKTTKRGGWRKNSSTIVHDLQLRCYARVVQREFNVPAKNIHAALYYLEGANLVAATFSDESLLAAEKELLEAYNQIKNMPPEAAWGNVNEQCRRCDYRKICPFYSIT